MEKHIQPILNNVENSRFEYHRNGNIAVCEYEYSDGIWYLNHTSVPESMRGEGVAADLARQILEYIESLNGSVVARCSFIASFIDRNRRFSRLLVPLE